MTPPPVPSPGPEPSEALEPTPSTRVPWALAAAVLAILVEGAVFIGLGVAEVVALDSKRLAMGLSTAGFFIAYGAMLAFCGRALWKREAWARSIVVMAQLIHLGTAWSNRDVNPVLAALAAATALVVLVGIFHPASLRAVDR